MVMWSSESPCNRANLRPAGNTVVAAAVSDAFEGARAKGARIFGRGRSDPGIQRRLDQTRQQLAASAPGELERDQATQARQWQANSRR
jgi:hypothetical protein